MIERIVGLGSEYVGTLAALARTEAAEDAARLRTAATATLLAVLVCALGLAWLNIAVLLWLLTTPWAIPGAFAIAAVAGVAGIVMLAGARRALGTLHPMQATRRVLAAEIGGREPGAPPLDSAPMNAEEAGLRLRSLRAALRETVSLGRGASADPAAAVAPPRFEPRSRTMRSAMWLWRTIPRVPAGTAITGALGVLAVSSPRLRRLLAMLALVRNLGGHARPAPRGGARSGGPFPFLH
ncbi:MAG: hypothetical protein EHM87_06355 [Burkholderiales bacterium]|nr:MAG: hypothetical protein EHM87_06355 [Burkholderiales bacterium]